MARSSPAPGYVSHAPWSAQGDALTGRGEVAREADASGSRPDNNDMAHVHRQNSASLPATIMRSRPPSAQDRGTPASVRRGGAARPSGPHLVRSELCQRGQTFYFIISI